MFLVFQVRFIFCTLPSIIGPYSTVYEVEAQTCQDAFQYDQCSLNFACGCLPLTNTVNDGICVYLHVTCSELISCAANNRACYQPDHICVMHPRCHGNIPLCYPMKMAAQALCPPMTTTPRPPMPPDDGICANATWNREGVTVAGGNREGVALNQLDYPSGLFVDDDGAVYIADTSNHRVVKWAPGVLSGQVVAGGNGEGNQSDQLSYIRKVAVGKNGTMFICDRGNRRIQRWFKDESHGQTIISNISCWGLAIDNEGSLYVSDYDKHDVIKWPSGQIVAGGNGPGAALNQLSNPDDLFVDWHHSVFVADELNSRVMKWPVGAKEGIVVAGGNEQEAGTASLIQPISVAVDQMGTVYVVDLDKHQILRWFKNSKSGSIIIGGLNQGDASDQLSNPHDLAFDRHGNLYVADTSNYRIQMFAIDKNSCDAANFYKGD